MPRLIVRPSETGVVSHELTDDLVTVGRAPDNKIQIDDPSISERHAQLQRSGEIYRLKDLDSTNGTRVNDETITEIALAVGDRLRFGQVEAYFEADQTEAAQALPELVAIEAKPAASSARPTGFANASPFRHRKKDKDPTRIGVLAAAAMALLVFLGSMIAVLLMRAPM
jgi:pSer/pThr/pTyr-binding forkhead associated (FHA) protein